MATFLLGGLWHGPLFGKRWMTVSGIAESEMAAGTGRVFGLSFLLQLAAAAVLALFIGPEARPWTRISGGHGWVVGATPKTMSRIARFRAGVAAIESVDEPEGARLAYRFGYADQPHPVREFRRMAGVTPTQFLALRTPEESHVMMD
jgi:AraC-like DNA-binding protein